MWRQCPPERHEVRIEARQTVPALAHGLAQKALYTGISKISAKCLDHCPGGLWRRGGDAERAAPG
jgi:hypothetical protein